MAKYKYIGKDGAYVGRFGKLRTGAIVDLYYSEGVYIDSRADRDDNSFVRVDDPESTAGVGTVFPKNTRYFDLTKISWCGTLQTLRYSKSWQHRFDICRAMREVGAVIPNDKSLALMSQTQLFELIYGEAKRLKWDQPNIIAPAMENETVSNDSDPVVDTVVVDDPPDSPQEEAQANTVSEEAAPEPKTDKPQKPARRVIRR